LLGKRDFSYWNGRSFFRKLKAFCNQIILIIMASAQRPKPQNLETFCLGIPTSYFGYDSEFKKNVPGDGQV